VDFIARGAISANNQVSILQTLHYSVILCRSAPKSVALVFFTGGAEPSISLTAGVTLFPTSAMLSAALANLLGGAGVA
jgi:hypothetical protein